MLFVNDKLTGGHEAEPLCCAPALRPPTIQMASITTHEHDEISLEAQRQRASEISRHEISKLAHELLKKHLDERLAKCVQTNLTERARACEKHAADAAKLATKHERENKEFEDARYAMIVDFDAQRNKLRPLPEKKLEEESLRHEILLETLKMKLVVDKDPSLQQIPGRYRGYYGDNSNYTCDPNSLEQAYKQLVRKHEAEWKVRHTALLLEVNKATSHQARLDLERDFQLRFAECDQRQKSIQQRQTEELKDLEKEHDSELKAVQEAGERAEAEMQEERLRVDGWWHHICDGVVACQQRIELGDRHAHGEIAPREEASAVDEGERAVPGTVSPDEGETVAAFITTTDGDGLEAVQTRLSTEREAVASDRTPAEELASSSMSEAVPVGLPAKQEVLVPATVAPNKHTPKGKKKGKKGMQSKKQFVVLPAQGVETSTSEALGSLVDIPADIYVEALPSTPENLRDADNLFLHVDVEPTDAALMRSSSPDSLNSLDFVEV